MILDNISRALEEQNWLAAGIDLAGLCRDFPLANALTELLSTAEARRNSDRYLLKQMEAAESMLAVSMGNDP